MPSSKWDIVFKVFLLIPQINMSTERALLQLLN